MNLRPLEVPKISWKLKPPRDPSALKKNLSIVGYKVSIVSHDLRDVRICDSSEKLLKSKIPVTE